MDTMVWENVTYFEDNITPNITSNNEFTLSRNNEMMKLLFRGYVLTTIAVFGIIGNGLSIIVLSQKRMRSSSINILLIGLQTCDLIFVTSMLLYLGLPTILSESDTFRWYNNYWDAFVKFFAYPSTFTAEIGSHYFTVLVTLERYVAVCKPLHAATFCSRKKAIIWSIIVGICSILYGVPLWLERRVEYNENLDKYVWSQTEFDKSEKYNEFFIVYCTLIVMYVIPFFILIIFNFRIWREIRKAEVVRHKMSVRSPNKKANDSNSLTLLLFAIVVTFIVTNLFQLGSNFTNHVFDLGRAWWTNWFIYPYNKCLITLNSSVNFLFYCLFGKQFRAELIRLFSSKYIYESCFHNSLFTKIRSSQNSSSINSQSSASSVSSSNTISSLV